jgi:ferrous iron transport protein A
MNALRKALHAGLHRFRGRSAAPQGQDVPAGAMPLSALPTGCGGRVAAQSGGHGLVARLAALGLTPDVAFEVAQNSGHGPVIVLVRETRFALGRGEAAQILVMPAEACSELQER